MFNTLPSSMVTPTGQPQSGDFNAVACLTAEIGVAESRRAPTRLSNLFGGAPDQFSASARAVAA